MADLKIKFRLLQSDVRQRSEVYEFHPIELTDFQARWGCSRESPRKKQVCARGEESKPDVRPCVAPRGWWRLAPGGNWRHLRASPLPVRVSVVLAPAESWGLVLPCVRLCFSAVGLLPPGPWPPIRGPWQWTSRKRLSSRSVASAPGGASVVGGPKPTLLGVQGALWVGQARGPHTPKGLLGGIS